MYIKYLSLCQCLLIYLYLLARPPEAVDHGEHCVVDGLGLGADDAGLEDEGEADQGADEAHQVPGLPLAKLPANTDVDTYTVCGFSSHRQRMKLLCLSDNHPTNAEKYPLTRKLLVMIILE